VRFAPLTFRVITKENGISNKMFTQTVRELEKTDLFPENFSCGSSQSGIQIDRERKIVENIYEVWISGALKIIRMNLGMFDLVINESIDTQYVEVCLIFFSKVVYK
jgi:hypothetical protein